VTGAVGLHVKRRKPLAKRVLELAALDLDAERLLDAKDDVEKVQRLGLEVIHQIRPSRDGR